MIAIVLLTGSVALMLIAILFIFAGSGWVTIMLSVKRTHDLAYPGSDVWRLFVPFMGIGLGLEIMFDEGTVGPNDYGEDPRR